MKTAILLAAGALASPAVAGIHKMKLQKVPLSEQLVSHDIAALRWRNGLIASEIRKHPGARKGARSEVHGHQARGPRRAGLQGALRRRRLAPSARQQLPERPMYV